MSQSVPRASRPGNHPAGQPGNWTDSQLRGHEHLREPGSQAASHGASQPNSHCRSTGEARTTVFQAESLMSFASMFSLMSFASMFFFCEKLHKYPQKKRTRKKRTRKQRRDSANFCLKNYGISASKTTEFFVDVVFEYVFFASGNLVRGRCCP